MMKPIPFLLMTVTLFLGACTPDPAEQMLTVTVLADRVFRQQTQNALTPTVTSTFTLTPSPTATITPSPTPTRTFTPSPVPDVHVLDALSAAYQGPNLTYPILYYIRPDSNTQAIGRDTTCSWVQVQIKGNETSWVENDLTQIQLNVPCEDLPLGTYRPGSGTIMVDARRRTDQFGFLWVNNTSGDDAIVIVANSQGTPVFGYYVWSGDNIRLDYIPFGSYRIYFTTGEGWLAGENRFRDNPQYLLMEGSYTFSSSKYWKVTLYAQEGNTTFETLDLESFPSINP
ncbi:MAG: hypothetical protein C0391_04475 [Anaerolinea sp.]|nr:hypothetical protein [Anaerolinea sp.]